MGPSFENGGNVQEIGFENLKFKNRVLGKGSYGQVIEAEYEGRTVAAKKINSEGLERELLAGVRELHPNILGVTAYAKDPDNKDYVWLILEIMDTDLENYIRKTPFDMLHNAAYNAAGSILDLIREIAEGMKHLHSNDIIHRDLKPANLLLDLKKGLLKIADFGNAKNLRHTTKMGTRGYWAPEMNIEEDTAKYSKKVDVYSYGVICRQLLTGKKPSDGVKQLKNNDISPRLLKSINKSLDQEQFRRLLKLINRCLDHNPDNRPTFDFICEELQLIQDSWVSQKPMSPEPGFFPKIE